MPFDRILVAIDGSEGGQHALTKAIELAKVAHASLLALAVEGPAARLRRHHRRGGTGSRRTSSLARSPRTIMTGQCA
jgi:nucleotide-binding universal stress UspA family protein